MRRLKLLNLTCVGKNGEYASVDFGSEVTVLRGSPNRDESIVDVILHIFDLRGYPLWGPWWRFHSFLLGVELPTGQHITFARSNSNHSSVFRLVGNAGKISPGKISRRRIGMTVWPSILTGMVKESKISLVF